MDDTNFILFVITAIYVILNLLLVVIFWVIDVREGENPFPTYIKRTYDDDGNRIGMYSLDWLYELTWKDLLTLSTILLLAFIIDLIVCHIVIGLVVAIQKLLHYTSKTKIWNHLTKSKKKFDRKMNETVFKKKEMNHA